MKPNFIINWLRLIVFIPFVLIFSLTFKVFDLGGAEWLIQIVLLSGIAWLYHTSSYCQVGNLSIKGVSVID